jgi:hypothetical protein
VVQPVAAARLGTRNQPRLEERSQALDAVYGMTLRSTSESEASGTFMTKE